MTHEAWVPATPPERVEVGEVELRRFRPSDAQALIEVVTRAREHLAPWVPWAEHFAPEVAESYLARSEPQWEERRTFPYGIWTGASLVGEMTLRDTIGPGRLELGYWLDPEHTGRGIVRRCAEALIDVTFAIAGVDAIEVRHDRANQRSRRLPEALGFESVGDVPRDRALEGGPSEWTTVWVLTRHARSAGQRTAS